MSCIVRRLTSAGLEPVDYSAESLSEASLHEPVDGVYTLTNTRNRFGVVAIDWHFDRLEDSAMREGIPLRLDRESVRAAVRRIIEESGFDDVRFRITVPRSGYPLIISIEPFAGLPVSVFTRGVRCVTVQGAIRSNAESKTTAWMHARKSISSSLPEGIYEAVLRGSDDALLEGTSSNFYAVSAAAPNVVRTAGDRVLPGIAQRILGEASADLCSIDFHPTFGSDIPLFAECFLTSSSRGIVPIVEMDGICIGSGNPGPLTLTLRSAYEEWVVDHITEL